ncbi:MAG: hypothetical protein JWO30_2306 [Fibrobacteres bacterium]|nr:hypothetical protein [Fibrobacterota bacterium]
MGRVFSLSALSDLCTPARLGAVAAMLLLLAPSRGHAKQGGDFGLGVVAGAPSGLSGKLWTGPNNAFDFIAGFSIVGHHDWIALNADYVWHDWDLIPVKVGQLPLYYGMGVWTRIEDTPVIGARGIVGLEYMFPSAPLDVFFEIGPGISILPSTDFDPSAGLGMRYFF